MSLNIPHELKLFETFGIIGVYLKNLRNLQDEAQSTKTFELVPGALLDNENRTSTSTYAIMCAEWLLKMARSGSNFVHEQT